MSAVPAVLVRDRVSPGPNNLVLSHCHFFSSIIFPKIRGFPGILNHYTGPKALVMGNFGSTSPRQFQLMDDYQFGFIVLTFGSKMAISAQAAQAVHGQSCLRFWCRNASP